MRACVIVTGIARRRAARPARRRPARRSAPMIAPASASLLSHLAGTVATFSRAARFGAQSPCGATRRRGRPTLTRACLRSSFRPRPQSRRRCFPSCGSCRSLADRGGSCGTRIDRRILWQVGDDTELVAGIRAAGAGGPGRRHGRRAPAVGLAAAAVIRKAAGRLAVPSRASAREPAVQLRVHGARPLGQRRHVPDLPRRRASPQP